MDGTIPAEIAAHLRELVETSDGAWSERPDSFRNLECLWIEKERLFEEQIKLLGMHYRESVPVDDERGMILTTYSGSLVALGPGQRRRFQYASIQLRSDVPDLLNGDGVSPADAIRIGERASFISAPVKQTSAIYRIAVLPGNLPVEEQESRIREAMVFLTASFVQLNRRLTSPGDSGPGHFDKKSMVRYLADNNALSRKAVSRLLDDYAVLLESGMLLGKTVSVGRLGRLSLAFKPVRKARIGRNPATGEEMTIPAKAAHMAPVFRFSSRVKERAANLPVEEEE